MNDVELLKEHCRFDNPDHVYVLLAVARKKDNETITNNTEVVFREVIKRETDIIRKYHKICNALRNFRDDRDNSFNFYLYVTVNPRDCIKAFFSLQHDFNSWLEQRLNGHDNENFKKIDGYWISALMKPESRGNRGLFLVDIDTKHVEPIRELIKEHTIIVRENKTKNGYHLLVLPFDRQKLVGLPKNVEIKTDALFFINYFKKQEE